MLLPALLQSYGYGGGSISTGDATAVGNDSDTFVRQVALAAASGDGVVDIVQQILVANMGAAGANTGGNVLGGGVATLSAGDASAIVMMAAFMSEMLALVHQSANGEVMASQSRGINVPFQGILLRLDASFSGLDTQVLGANGTTANLRQVTIIVSLGLANSNTGHNNTVNQGNVVNGLQTGDSIQILAGDAEVTADQLVVICQRINADDIDCLAPPTTTPGTSPILPGSSTTTDPGSAIPDPGSSGGALPGTATPDPVSPNVASGFGHLPQGPLPETGVATDAAVIIASVVILAGGTLLLLSKRKKDIA